MSFRVDVDARPKTEPLEIAAPCGPSGRRAARGSWRRGWRRAPARCGLAPSGLDARLVHERLVEGADLALERRRARGRRSWRRSSMMACSRASARSLIAGAAQTPGLSPGIGGAVEPGAVGVAEEVVAGLGRRVAAGEVEAPGRRTSAASARRPGGAGGERQHHGHGRCGFRHGERPFAFGQAARSPPRAQARSSALAHTGFRDTIAQQPGPRDRQNPRGNTDDRSPLTDRRARWLSSLAVDRVRGRRPSSGRTRRPGADGEDQAGRAEGRRRSRASTTFLGIPYAAAAGGRPALEAARRRRRLDRRARRHQGRRLLPAGAEGRLHRGLPVR